jgi:hypothetical protein
MKNDTAGDGPHGGWDQQTQSLDYAYDWHTMSARESHKEARHEYDNTTNLTPEALASMPPPSRSDKVDKVADDNSNDGSEPIYTPPGSIECKSPPFGKRRPEVDHPKQTTVEASCAVETFDQLHKLIIRPDHVSLHAVAIKKELKKCEAALSNIASSLPNANSYQAELEDRWAFLYNRYKIVKAGYFVPSKRTVDTVLRFGADSKGAKASVETSIGRGTATSSAAPLVDESKDGRPAKSFTSPPVQTEPRTLEELTEANFYSLTKTEKARVLLPLLTKVYPATGDSPHPSAAQHPEDVASLEDQFGSNHTPSFEPSISLYKVHTRPKSSPKAFNNVLHKISKGTDCRAPALPHPVHRGGYNRPSNDVATSSSSDRIEMTLQGASSKLRTLDQKLNDLKNFNDDGNLNSPVPADSVSILSKNVRTQIPSQFENNRGARAEQLQDYALYRPYVVDDEMLSARIVRQFEHAKGMTPSMHNSDAFDPAHFVTDPELSKLLSKMSDREDTGGSVQGSDQDKPDWFEGLVQDEDDEVYIGNPSSSPWQSQNQGDSDAHWGGQGHHAGGESSGPARHLKSVKESQPGRFVPCSPATQMQRASQSERVPEGFAEKPQHDSRRQLIDDQANARSDSTTRHVSSAYDQEVTDFGHSDGCNSGGFKNPFWSCDSCRSIYTFEDPNGSGCMSCGFYTERSIASREWARELHRGRDAVPEEAAAIAPPKVFADDGWAPPVHWDILSVQRAEGDGWGTPRWGAPPVPRAGDDDWATPLVQDSDTTGDGENSVGGWTATNRDAVWHTDSIADEDRLLANMAEDSLRMCEERSELLEPVQLERKLAKKEKKRLLKTKKQPKETKQSKNKKNKHAKAAVSKDFAAAKQGLSHKPAAKLESSLFDSDAFGLAGGDNDTARRDKDCREGTANIDAKFGTDGEGRHPRVCTEDKISGCWGGDRLYSADTWGSNQSRKGIPIPSDRAFDITPKPCASTPKNYTITYWATAECGDQIIHIPIDDNNISGPEKTVLEGPAKKVWKWVREKGLGGKVGLQDAFDLANDLHGDDKKEVAGSNPWSKSSPPPSLRRSPSPARTEQYLGQCHGCDEPGGWWVCED